jgi:dipeptidyl aminopeptidase/acylaminoacyl peptidase
MKTTRCLGLLTAVVIMALGCCCAAPSAAEPYAKAPPAIRQVLDAPATPQVSINPTRTHLLLVQGVRYPSIADVSQPMLRLAGARINPQTNGPHGTPRIIGLTLQAIPDGEQKKLAVPPEAKLGTPRWAPDGRHFAVTNTTAKGIELWIGDVQTAALKLVPGLLINAAYGEAVQWLPDNNALLCQSIPPHRGAAPAAPQVPPGPTVQESSGKAAPVRTYQDLLQNPHDEDLFDYYATSQLVRVDLKTLTSTPVGKPGVFSATETSPDGSLLFVVRLQRPYSYLLPAAAFPREIELWSRDGQLVQKLASKPLEDQVPIEGVPTGPRGYQWRPTEPATLDWVEALDGGDPKNKAPHRDRLMTWKAPFKDQPQEVLKLEHRFAGITYGEKSGLALIRDFERNRRWTRTFIVDLEHPELDKPLWDRSMLDRYRDPGRPLMRTTSTGQSVLWQSGDAIFLDGNGATPTGDRPFLDRLDLKTRETKRLFQSDASAYESVVGLMTADGTQFLTRRETPTEPPNYQIRTAGSGEMKKLTHFEDPTPQLRGIKKQLVTYKRGDGVQLSMTLYLPPDYQAGQRLPAVLWAYPREFTDPDTAGQVSGSEQRFTTIGGMSHLFFLLQGYAVLDGATMPVVGDPETVNNTFIDQIVASAKAAIDKADEMGVIDRHRVGVGGHSYGAFMTANLLAHSDLFRAGIARSGAYNRTLTPFGFQSERRTLWEAPEMYMKVSPFLAAHKLKEPLLLIHGEADNNAGTFPIQSERMYHAVKGNGGTVRLVMLPHESHGYAARESIEHTLHEMLAWFDKHVKHAGSNAAR